ncbi:hypothetical protein ACHAWC_003990 [Mediolabrus comicus]
MRLHPNPSSILLAALTLSALLAAVITNYNGLLLETDSSPSSQRRLLQSLSIFTDPKSITLRSDSDGGKSGNPKTYSDRINQDVPLPTYSLKDAIHAATLFQSRFAILRYDPSNDRFIGYYSKNHLYVSGCGKLNYSIEQLVRILRATFPERFTPDSPELVMTVQAGDFPDVMPYRKCISDRDAPCERWLKSAAPVLTFGSVFTSNWFPNFIAMPMPSYHLPCFVRWAVGQGICPFFQNTQAWSTTSWDELVPQLVWRGTDFRFLSIVRRLDRPTFEKYIDGQIDPNDDPNEAVTAILKKNFLKFLPRWKGVILTAESEIEARQTGTLPKVNIKFPHGAVKDKHWDEIGFPATGDYIDKAQLATYKYHIDIGGGGGTTWSGTIDKLKMPGLLLHHETAAKDYIFDDIQPWVHYVPVKEDLTDVMEKLEWADTHPAEAKQIADNASTLMEFLGQNEGFQALFERHMVKPLAKVIEAYQPMDLKDDAAWDEAFSKLGGDNFERLIECTTIDEHCHLLEAAKDYDERDPSVVLGIMQKRNKLHNEENN